MSIYPKTTTTTEVISKIADTPFFQLNFVSDVKTI